MARQVAAQQGAALPDRESDTDKGVARGSILPVLLVVCAVWAVAVLRWVLTDSVVPWDSKNQFYAFFRFLAESLHAGTSPFWNPYHYGGHPSIADPQSLVLWPPFLLWALVDRAPSLRTFDLIVHAHLLAGGLAMAGLGWRRQWPAAASVLAAVVFMLGGAASARLNHTGIILCYGLFPLAWLTLEIALERRSIVMGALFAVTVSLIVLGRNQVALMLCLMLLGLGLREIAISGAPLRYLRERAVLLAVIVAIGVAITAVPLLLTLQLAVLSNRPEVLLAEALEGSLHPANLATMMVPDVFGAHAPMFSYWGPQYTVTPEVAATDGSFNYMFVGAAPAVLLLWLGIAGGGLGRPGRRTLAAMLAAATLFALGRYTPLFPLVFEHVPGFAYFRRPVDATFVLGVLIALLAGQLLADFVRAGLPRMNALASAVVLAAGTAVLAAAAAISSVTGHAYETLVAASLGAAMLGVVGLALIAARSANGRRIAAMAIAAVATGELLYWNAASRLNAEHSRIYGVLENASAEDAEALRLLGSELERRHAEGARPRVEIVGLDGAWQNLAVVQKIEATTGYNPLRIGIYDRFVAPSETGWLAAARRFPASFDAFDCAIARALGLEYLVLDRPIEELRQVSRPTQLETLRAGPKVWIYRIPGALPRVRFSSQIRLADADSTTMTGELANAPAQEQVLIDIDTPPRRAVWQAALEAGPGKAAIKSWRPGQIVVDVDAPTAGVLVLNDIYYPGWIAELDGERVPIMRADVLFRGVEIPAGRHTVVFRFEPLKVENLLRAVHEILAHHHAAPSQPTESLNSGEEQP